MAVLVFAPIAAQEEVTLVIASFYPVDQTAGWDGLVADFEAAHPGVTIETQVTTFDEYLPRLLTQIAGGGCAGCGRCRKWSFPTVR